jgi:hypothetical protein
MKYLLLAYIDGQQWETISASEREALEEACLVNDEALRESGYLLATLGFQKDSVAVTVRVQNGKLSLKEGSITKTKERPVGLLFIQARDLNEAIRVVSKMPQAQRGPVEVRLVQDGSPAIA